MSKEERIAKLGENYVERYLLNFFTHPPGGESRLDIGLQWDRIMHSLSQRHPEHRVVIVAHETIIESGIFRRLHWTLKEFYEWKRANDPATKIHNCQIIQFSRRDPVTLQVIDKVRWWRSICPWNLTLTDSSWRPIVPRRYSSAELLSMADRYLRLINI